MTKHIPNFFTLLNLICGCLAVIFILQTGETLIESDEGTWVPQLPEKIWWGSILIGIAAVIDFLDGFVARLFRATSEMGKQLDSLADVVSFGVAPGMILYQLLRISFVQEEHGLDTSFWALAPALIFPAAAAWRLARFNTGSATDTDFTGVPSPAAGLFVASLPLIMFYNYFNVNTVLVSTWTLYAIIIVISWLMISNVKFLKLKFSRPSSKGNVPNIVLVVIAVIAGIVLKWLAVPVVFLAYVILSLTMKKQLK